MICVNIFTELLGYFCPCGRYVTVPTSTVEAEEQPRNQQRQQKWTNTAEVKGRSCGAQTIDGANAFLWPSEQLRDRDWQGQRQGRRQMSDVCRTCVLFTFYEKHKVWAKGYGNRHTFVCARHAVACYQQDNDRLGGYLSLEPPLLDQTVTAVQVELFKSSTSRVQRI